MRKSQNTKIKNSLIGLMVVAFSGFLISCSNKPIITNHLSASSNAKNIKLTDTKWLFQAFDHEANPNSAWAQRHTFKAQFIEDGGMRVYIPATGRWKPRLKMNMNWKQLKSTKEVVITIRNFKDPRILQPALASYDLIWRGTTAEGLIDGYIISPKDMLNPWATFIATPLK